MQTIYLPEPNCAEQRAAYESGALFKVFRAGRRAGKTVLDVLCAVVGHGPVEGGKRRFLGLQSGKGDVFWVLPTRTARNSIWNDAIRQRFPKDWLNETDLVLTLPNGGRLWVISAEAIGTVRGSGARLLGVIVDEAAHLDLRLALQQVIMPACMDNEAWLILSSTTNAGPDGGKDENDQTRSPSYFNTICEEIRAGTRDAEWSEFYWTAEQNPRISQRALDRLVREYPAGSMDLEQEVWAKLLVAGGRLAFPELDERVHVQNWRPEREPLAYTWSCGGDWGHTSPGWFGLFATSRASGRTMCRAEMYFKGLTPKDAGVAWSRLIRRFPEPEFMVLDEPAVADGGPSILTRVQEGIREESGLLLPMSPPPKGPGSREAAKLEVHAMLAYEKDKDGNVPEWSQPLLVFHPECRDATRTLWRLPQDPRGKSDVDTKAEDHPYDGLKDWVMCTRGPARDTFRERIEKASRSGRHADDHPGRRTLMQQPTPDSHDLFATAAPTLDASPGDGWQGSLL